MLFHKDKASKDAAKLFLKLYYFYKKSYKKLRNLLSFVEELSKSVSKLE